MPKCLKCSGPVEGNAIFCSEECFDPKLQEIYDALMSMSAREIQDHIAPIFKGDEQGETIVADLVAKAAEEEGGSNLGMPNF